MYSTHISFINGSIVPTVYTQMICYIYVYVQVYTYIIRTYTDRIPYLHNLMYHPKTIQLYGSHVRYRFLAQHIQMDQGILKDFMQRRRTGTLHTF